MSRRRSWPARRRRSLLIRHVLPNTVAPLIVQGTFICANAILIEAILSFLGVGIPPETPTWGNIMAEGRGAVPHLPAQHLLPGHLPRADRARRQHARRRLCATRLDPQAGAARDGRGRARPRRPRSHRPAARAAPIARTPSRTSRSPSRPGEIVCVVGESGSGKSVTAHAVMGLLPREILVPTAGAIAARRRGSADEPRRARLRDLRGTRMAMIFQEPMTALNPVHAPSATRSTRCCDIHTQPQRARAARRGARDHGRGAPARAGAPDRRLPAPALRRPAPAHHDRGGAGARPRRC